MRLFATDADFEAFRRVMLEAYQHHPIRILSYCVMSNHWHFVVWPEKDRQLTAFFRWLSHTHAMRWRVSHRTVGYGPLYHATKRANHVSRVPRTGWPLPLRWSRRKAGSEWRVEPKGERWN